MKHFITLISLLLVSLSTYAQNPMFLGFDYQYDGVKKWLTQYDQIKWLSQEANHKIVIEHNQAKVTYMFNQGQLYQIEMCRDFSNKKEGKAAFEGCLRYFKMIATNEMAFTRDEGKHCKIIEKSGKLYDLHLVPAEFPGEEGFQLRLSSRDPKMTPMNQREESDYDLTIMQEHEALTLLQVVLASACGRHL